MRKLLAIVVFTASLCGAAKAHAGWVIEGSLGKGGQVTAPRAWEPTNVMAAPGYEFLGLLRAQLGLVGALGDVKNSKFDLQLRPMIGLYPPIIPVYVRAIFAMENFLHRPFNYAVGGAAGIKIGLPFIGLGLFAEAGYLPTFVKAGGSTQTVQIIEGRLGAFWTF
ncbi:MAG TPA: hypothetical protein VGP07_09455 [Polyangia bacterium]|jgi:hypothetical protein